MSDKTYIDLHTLVRVTEDIVGEVNHFVIPKGAVGYIVESYTNPEAHQVDFDLFESGEPQTIQNDTALLYPHQFEVVDADDHPSQTAK